MSDFRQTAADRFERAADRMSNAGFLDEERSFRDAAAQIRAGLSLEEIQALEQRMLTGQKPSLVNRLTALAAMGEYDSGGGGDSQGSAASSTADAVDDETVITDLESGASQLLSTAASTGLSDPFSSAQGGWISSSQNINPYTTLDGASDVNNPNFYTGGQNINPFTGESTDSFSGSVTTPQSPQPTDPAWAAFGYSGPPPSILSSPDLLAANDVPNSASVNIASDATSAAPVANVAGGPTFDTDYAGNNYFVYTQSDGSVIWVDPDTGAVSQPQLNIPVTPGAAPQYPPDFVFDDGTETPAAQTTTNTQSVAPVAAAVDPQLTPAQEAQLNAAIQQAVGPPDPNPVNAGPPGSINDVLSGTDWAPAAPEQNQPSDQPGSQPGQTMEQQDQENWDAAKSGMWDSAVDMAQGLLTLSWNSNPAFAALSAFGIKPSLDWAKSGPPAPTGNAIRDAQLLDNYQSGGWVTTTVSIALPIGAEGILDSALTAATKLPALEGMGIGGGGRLIGPTEQWLSAFGESGKSLGPELPALGPGLREAVGEAPTIEITGEADVYFHYTSEPESSFAGGFWRDASVTNLEDYTAAEASQLLGIPTPDKVIPIIDTASSSFRYGGIVPESARYAGGGLQWFATETIPESSILPAESLALPSSE